MYGFLSDFAEIAEEFIFAGPEINRRSSGPIPEKKAQKKEPRINVTP